MKAKLYRRIETHEFRGQGYFEADYAHGAISWNDTTPPEWKFALHPGDHYILRRINDDEYVIEGGRIYNTFGIPHNTPGIEYRVRRDQLTNIQPRV